MDTIKDVLLRRQAVAQQVESNIAQFKAAIKAEERRLAAVDKEIRDYLDNKLLTEVSVRLSPTEVLVAKVVPQQVAVVKDWDMFYEWLRKTGKLHYLHKRVASTAVVEAYQAARSELETSCIGLSPDDAARVIADAIPSGVVVDEFDKVVFKLSTPPKPRRVSSTT